MGDQDTQYGSKRDRGKPETGGRAKREKEKLKEGERPKGSDGEVGAQTRGGALRNLDGMKRSLFCLRER